MLCTDDKTTIFLAKTMGLEKKLVPKEYGNAASYLKDLTIQGMNKRFPNETDHAFLEKRIRIEEELMLIVSGSYENYFLIVHDYVSWAKEHSIMCSPGCGSTAGSLVCYCLGITDVDPVANNLIFERFYKSGKSISIYLEVDSLNKSNVIDYITEKYADFCVAFLTPDDENYMKFLLNDSFMSFSIVGSEVLSELNKAKQLIQETDKTFSFESIPENDLETYLMIEEGGIESIYQLEFFDNQEILRKLGPINFDNLTALISMYRPGPSKFISQYIDVKNGKTDISYPDVALKQILEPTCGILVYQEQLMHILHDYAGFDYSDADDIRRIMQTKRLDKHPEIKDLFIKESLQHGHSTESAEKVFDFLYTNSCYAFPKAHALSHAKLTYWHAYIKCHYSKVFLYMKMIEKMENK